MVENLLISLIDYLFLIVNSFSYFGIFVGMIIESSFIPFPSEIILIPAGALISKGSFSFLGVFSVALIGSLIGAYINYFLAFFLGRRPINFLVEKYGTFFLISKSSLEKVDYYFKNNGEITTFVGRLIPGIRQLISIPAGFAKMNFFKFTFFTLIGAGIWSLFLILFGYFLGANFSLYSNYLNLISYLIGGIFIILFFIILIRKRKLRF